MGVSPPNGPSKIQTFYLLSWAPEIFKVSKHKGKIKFDIIWGYQNEGPPKRGHKNCNFLITHVRHMKFSE